MFTKQRASAEALNSAASFYSRISQAGKKQAEADLLGLKDPQKYRRNTFGRYLVTAVLLFQLVGSLAIGKMHIFNE